MSFGVALRRSWVVVSLAALSCGGGSGASATAPPRALGLNPAGPGPAYGAGTRDLFNRDDNFHEVFDADYSVGGTTIGLELNVTTN